MNFQPRSKIYFLRTGIDEQNKVVFKNQSEMFNILTSEIFFRGVMEECSFQRADGFYIIRVDHNNVPYYSLLQCDTIVYKNEEQTGVFPIVGNILGVEWKNENCSYVRFKVDYFMTYQTNILWDQTYAMVEREHIKKDWSASGNPMFSNMGPAEDFGTVADTPFFSWTKTFTPDQVVIFSPYDSSGAPEFNGKIKGNLYSSLQTQVTTPDAANTFFKAIAENKEASINNIVSVQGIPSDWSRVVSSGGGAFGGDRSEDIPAVNIAGGQLASMPKYRNAKCWSSPFVNIRLMSSEGGTVDFTPQWLGNDQSTYTVSWRAAGCGGMFGGCQCTFRNKNGAFNWDVWNDFIVAITNLPSCPWTGDGFTDWNTRNRKTEIMRTASQFVQNTIGGLSGIERINDGDLLSGAGQAIGGLMNNMTLGAERELTINNQKATGATVNGVATFNNLLDIGLDKWGFKVVYYCTQIYTMNSVDSYFDRFGYRVSKLKKLELENRPIWTFVKTAECHVASSVGVPYIAEAAINNMFNRGVTMWKSDKFAAGRKIGDYSNPEENKGIA